MAKFDDCIQSKLIVKERMKRVTTFMKQQPIRDDDILNIRCDIHFGKGTICAYVDNVVGIDPVQRKIDSPIVEDFRNNYNGFWNNIRLFDAAEAAVQQLGKNIDRYVKSHQAPGHCNKKGSSDNDKKNNNDQNDKNNDENKKTIDKKKQTTNKTNEEWQHWSPQQCLKYFEDKLKSIRPTDEKEIKDLINYLSTLNMNAEIITLLHTNDAFSNIFYENVTKHGCSNIMLCTFKQCVDNLK